MPINTRDINGVKTKLFYLEAASIMGIDDVRLEACGGELCGSVDIKDVGQPWLFVDIMGEGTLRIDDLQYAVFSSGGENESRWVRISPGRHSISLLISPVRMFGERKVEFKGAYIVYREPNTFNLVLKAKLLLDVAEAFEDLRSDYLEVLNDALDRVFLDSIANWQLEFAVKAHLVDPPWFIKSLFNYYDSKELTHLTMPDVNKLSNEAKDALEALERGIEELRARRGHRGLVYVAGHAHIDLGWLWSEDVTKQKVKRTLINVISLSKDYPELTFLISNMAYLKWIRDEDPQLFIKIKELFRNGRLIPVGGSWVEFDANLPGGESLARQFLYGQRFLLREFGRISEIAWLPDTFGFPATLPQILRRAGVKAFFEHKMYWNTVNKFPYSVFLWEGIDGTVMPTVNYATYGADLTPSQIAKAWNDHTSPELPAFLPFGKGDGGGGPTWLMLERYRAYKDLPGLPRLIMGDLENLVSRLSSDNSLPRWRGELYLEIHRGVYSNGIRLKQLVRKLETKLRELEELSVVFNVRRSYEDYWHPLLEAEYHDPMGATSTRNVYEEILGKLENTLGKVENEIMNLLRNALGTGDHVTIVNTLPWSRVDFVELKTTPEGLPAQKLNGKYLVKVSVGPLGYVSFKSGKPSDEIDDEVVVNGNRIENSMLSVIVDGGDIKVFDKESNRWAVVKGYLMACEDMPSRWDGWDIEGWYRRVCNKLRFEGSNVIEHGPLRACIDVNYSFRKSSVKQTICLYSGDRRIEVKNDVDWRERLVLLKAFYELSIFGRNASFEVPYGVVDRPTRPSNSWEIAKFEVPAVKWVDVYDPDYGVAIINDGRQGYSVDENMVSITLLRSPLYPNPYLDYGKSNFTYVIYPHINDWRSANVPRKAYEVNQPLLVVEGTQGGEATFLSIDNPAVILEALKWGEDGGVVMRFWETHGINACTRVNNWLGARDAVEVDILEHESYDRLDLGRLCLRPFEVKTILIK